MSSELIIVSESSCLEVSGCGWENTNKAEAASTVEGDEVLGLSGSPGTAPSPSTELEVDKLEDDDGNNIDI